MAAPTSTYCDYAAGNDYKGATFTDGAYTSATKTLVKTNAFTANKVNHWLKLSSSAGGSIVTGYYKIATWTDASTVILATDAGGGVDATDVACTQHDGTTTLPWRSVQGALDLITRDATNGNQVNVKAGTAQVNQAALTLTTYGTPAETAPLVFRGYTTAANDGGIGEIDANGAALLAANGAYQVWADMEIHNFGNNAGITASSNSNSFYNCEIHKGASTPSGKVLLTTSGQVIRCYIHDAGSTGTGVVCNGLYYSYIYNCPTGCTTTPNIINNIFVDCDAPIVQNGDQRITIGNTVYSSTARTGTGINAGSSSSNTWGIVFNNIVEGYSGAGGKGIASSGDLAIAGYNALYNNTTPESYLDVFLDLGGDATPASSPFTNAGSGDFSLNTAVAGAIEAAWPGVWPGLATTTNKQDMGAIQNGAGAGTTDTLEVRAGIG